MSSESTSWRTVLSVIFIIVSLIRIVSTCSNSNRSSNSLVNSDLKPYVITQEKAEELMKEREVNNQVAQFEKNRRSNNLFYKVMGPWIVFLLWNKMITDLANLKKIL